MNSVLPAGIESYLKEAGFSSTEMLILRKLVEEDSFTLRELASKTGKSTGVLDQAMKKLLNKKIARKEIINDQPRYSIDSLDAVVKWMQDDMKIRKESLERRHQNFETFISSLKHDKHRPDMEHFQGIEGIQKAYLKLLEPGEELLTFTPVLHLAEDDPLRAFRVDYFRKRQYRKIFQRVLAPDTPLARRFQSRDPFEYRKTLLLPETEYPMTFEKTIVDGTIACINFTDQTASFLKYPDLATSERVVFETMWTRALAHEKKGNGDKALEAAVTIPLDTKILSSLRQFFLGRRSLLALLVFAVVSAVLTFGLYKSNRDLNLQRLKEKVISIASTGALQFDAADVNAVWKPEDIQKPEYAKLVATLNLIRRSNTDIQYTYIMRKTDDPLKMAFVADADSLYPNQKKDLNRDGVIDEADALSIPGELYGDFYPFIREALIKPMASVATDLWGTFISGHAPIRDKDGNAVAILGVDIFLNELDRLSASTFTPLYAFIGFFILFVLLRFGAVNRSLMDECWTAMKRNMRLSLLWSAFVLALIIGLIVGFQKYKYNLLVDQTGKRLMAIAITAADTFDPGDLRQLRFARDMRTEAYQRVFKQLNDIRNQNQGVAFAYVVRPTHNQEIFEFVADSDSNFNLPVFFKFHIDDLSPLDLSDANVWPGYAYDDSVNHLFAKGLKKPTYDVSMDQWGSFISGCAPIFGEDGRENAAICLDVELKDL